MKSKEQSMIDELVVYDADKERTLFSDETVRYIIPLYQRAYAWADVPSDSPIEQLIDDVLEHDGENYYIGSLIVHKCGTKYEVIDGQQRLTTLLLLMTELELPVKNILSFDCRKKADNTLSKFIDKKEVLDEDLEQSLVKGMQIIREKLQQSDVDKKLLIDNLSHIRLYRIQVPPKTDLNRYFEIMNTRGEQLEQHDILKATLMSEIENVETRNLFAKIWEASSDMTGYVQMHFEVADRDALFGYGWNWMPEVSEYEITLEKEEEFALSLDDILRNGSVESYEETDKNERVRFESVIEFPYFLLHVLRVYVDTQNVALPEDAEPRRLLDDKKLIREFDKVIRYGKIDGRAICDNKEAFSVQFMDCLLKCRFLFDKYIIKREFANESVDGEWSLKQLEVSGQESRKKAYFKNTVFKDKYEWKSTSESRNKNNLMLQSALRVSYTSPKVMHWITELLIWLYDEENREGWYQYEEVIEGIAIKAVKENFLDSGDYRMGVNTPRIVFNYLDYLLWWEDKKKYSDFVFEFRNSVEHWYPQHPSEDTFETWEQEEVDHFGNLCIIQRNVNSRFSNMAPLAKKSTFKKMINKGSLKLQLMAEKTGSGNSSWRNQYEEFGEEMLAKLKYACGIEE